MEQSGPRKPALQTHTPCTQTPRSPSALLQSLRHGSPRDARCRSCRPCADAAHRTSRIEAESRITAPSPKKVGSNFTHDKCRKLKSQPGYATAPEADGSRKRLAPAGGLGILVQRGHGGPGMRACAALCSPIAATPRAEPAPPFSPRRRALTTDCEQGVLYGITSPIVGHPLDTVWPARHAPCCQRGGAPQPDLGDVTQVKTKMQSQAGYAQGGAIRTLSTVVKTEGFMALWRGLPAPLAGSMVFRSVQFSAYGAWCERRAKRGVTARLTAGFPAHTYPHHRLAPASRASGSSRGRRRPSR